MAKQGASIGAFAAQAAQRLAAAELSYGHGTRGPDEEAAWIALWAAGRAATEAEEFDAVADLPLTEAQWARAEQALQQRLSCRQPLAYVLGEAWLMGWRFRVDPRVIVPRSFIAELLAEGAFDPWLPQEPRRVMDLCTGSGCLAILAALAWPQAQVDAVDVSVDALAVAADNVADYSLQSRVRLLRSDLWQQVPPVRYDLLLCNPPYVPQASMDALPPEYRAEPALALAGGADGLDLVRRILAELPQRLTPQGVAVIEIGHERAAFEAAYPDLPVIWLDAEGSGDAVFLLQAADLPAAR